MTSYLHSTEAYSQSELLSDISPEGQADIFKAGHRNSYNAGEILFHEGDQAFRCYFVQSGRIKVSILHEEGKEAILRYVLPGEFMAAIAVFRGKTYPATASAVGPVSAISWDRTTMITLMHLYPPLAVNMLRVVVDRLDEVQKRYLELSAEQVAQRIARALLRMMKTSGRKTDEGIVIDFRLSRQDLADYTGTTLFSVSRVLSKWEKMGHIKSGRERIVITDAHALVAVTENS
ncbi:MAG: Crp/Fnr family transcriptional regulator [Desulfatitalea sp. BRH_c12]|nr:MAG: Crp/Fnr family transcriptional regulator [Desulfatitalea sp. BRH_c12]